MSPSVDHMFSIVLCQPLPVRSSQVARSTDPYGGIHNGLCPSREVREVGEVATDVGSMDVMDTKDKWQPLHGICSFLARTERLKPHSVGMGDESTELFVHLIG